MKEEECEMCLHKVHKGECKEIVELDKRLQKELGKKKDICGCMG